MTLNEADFNFYRHHCDDINTENTTKTRKFPEILRYCLSSYLLLISCESVGEMLYCHLEAVIVHRRMPSNNSSANSSNYRKLSLGILLSPVKFQFETLFSWVCWFLLWRDDHNKQWWRRCYCITNATSCEVLYWRHTCWHLYINHFIKYLIFYWEIMFNAGKIVFAISTFFSWFQCCCRYLYSVVPGAAAAIVRVRVSALIVSGHPVLVSLPPLVTQCWSHSLLTLLIKLSQIR